MFDDYTQWFEAASKAKYLAVDTEGDGLDVRDADSGAITSGVSIAFRMPNGSLLTEYFAFEHKIGMNQPELYEPAKKLIENHPCLVFHNARHDILALDLLAIDVWTSFFYDTLSMCHWINENHPSYTLDWVANHYIGKKKNRSQKMDEIIRLFGWEYIPVEDMRPYSANDTGITLELFERILPEFQAQAFDGKLWADEICFLRTLIKMETTGIRIDTELCEREITKGKVRMEEIVSALGQRKPSEKKVLEQIFFQELNLPVVVRTPKGVPSFNKEAMEEYDLMLAASGNPVARLVREFRGWQKVVATNYEAYLRFLGKDKRLHPHYMVHRTKTSRLSCGKDDDGKTEVKSPNLQNIPRLSEKEWDGNLKAAFIPAEGYRLWDIDYSNLELRVTAAYSADPKLKESFANGRNVFDDMSAEIGWKRHLVKTGYYAIFYNAGDAKVALQLGILHEQAKAFRDRLHQTYSKMMKYKHRVGQKASRQGWIKYWTGRRRHFQNAKEAAHLAFNSLIQGGAAELVKNRLIAVGEVIDWDEAKLLLQVHDSFVLEIKIGCEDKWLPLIIKTMEDVPEPLGSRVPFKVEVKEWGKAA